MHSITRIKNIVWGILMLLGGLLMMVAPKDTYLLVILLLDISFLLYGIRMLVYYFTMTRYMVGGIMTLYKSIIAIDFGIFIFGLDDVPGRIVMLYLMGIMVFNGAVVILSGIDSMKLKAPFWKTKLVYGGGMLLLAVACLFSWDSVKTVTIIYGLSLIHSGLYNIAKAFQRTAIIHIS